jgi:hypothetical protein
MLSSGTGTFPVTLKTAGPQTVTATDTVHISITGSVLVLVNVDASSTTHFEMSAPSSAIAGQNFYITVTAKDQLGNRVNGYNGTVQFTSNDIQAVLPGDSTLTSGTATFSITLKTAGPRTITAADKSIPSITGTSNNIIVVANDTVPGFILITPSSAIISAGGSQTFKVELFDIYNNSLGEVTSSVNSWGINSGAGTYLWTGNSVTVSKAGDWTVTASYNGVLNATAELVVKGHLPGIISITVTPKTASIAAGTSQSFTATASDGYNTWDVTNQTGWSIDVAAGGLWDQTAGTYTAAKAGNWIITASLNSLSDTATLTVTVNTELFDHIAISPKTSTIAAGQSQLYSATAFDTYGNGWSVTAVYTCPNSNLTITGNSASSTVAGSYTINGTYNSKSASASLTVTHATDVAYLDYITASVSPTSVAAPGLVTGSATAFDTFGNSWVVSTDATWSIPAGNDGGSWSGNVYTSHSAGVYSVEASFGGKTASASLTVTHAADKTYLDHIVIKPKESVVTVSVPQSYTATAYDSFGNNWTATATYTCPNSNVTVTVNLAYSNTAGSYTITGTFNGKVDTATLIVTGHLPTIASITIAPKTASVTTGSSQAFTATASDGYNTWDITNSAKWNINTTAGGAWTGPSYLSAKTGTWTVTATSDGVSDTATLTVIGDSSSSTSATSTSTTNVMPPTKTYTISFKQHGLPDGETWSVTFKGVTKTSTTSIITFGDIAAGDYTWSTDNMINQSDNTRYTMNGANKGSIHVPTITTQIVTYGTQYYLAINSSYSNPIGAGWYDAGSIAQFSIDSQTSTQYSFASWTGTGNGSYTGPDTTASIIINGPITETANWEQTTSLWLVLLITLILFGLLIAIFLAWKKRKKKKEDTAQQQLKQAGNPNPKLHFFGVNQKIISFKLLSLSINFNRSAK